MKGLKIFVWSMMACAVVTKTPPSDTPKAERKPIPQNETDGAVSDYYFRYAANNIPHHSKRDKGGEDAWVANEKLLVVADGVGGWARHGIDSGLFSKQLVHNIKTIFEKNEAQELKNVLAQAVETNG